METPTISHIKTGKQQKRNKTSGVYMNTLITKKITVPIRHINRHIKKTLEQIVKEKIEGKCSAEGYIKFNSCNILTFSSGLVSGTNIIFEVVIECLVCHPVEGMNIDCVAKNITTAGIRAEINEEPSPVIIFIARDHHHMSQVFSNIKEGDIIKVKVIGQRFELNDKYVSLIASLVDKKITEKKKSLLIIN